MIRALAFIWLGLVLGVSFLATPVKFRAETLTLPVALDVGRATFHAFGRIEWVLSALLLALAIGFRGSLEPLDWLLILGVIAIVVVESLVLIPRLDLRVESIIAGRPPPESRLHLVYVLAEVVKAVALAAVGVWTASHL